MKKILIGTCDIGNGHLARQCAVIRVLLLQDVQIVVAVTDKNEKIFAARFPEIPRVKVRIPWVVSGPDGIDFQRTQEIHDRAPYDYFAGLLRFAQQVEQAFGGKPDFVISDYEPTSAQYAYAAGLPLISMEQQSKFRFIQEPAGMAFSAQEEKARLQMFFPRVDLYLLSSFFALEAPKKQVVVLPPIVEKPERLPACANKGIVYFSPYADDPLLFEKVLNMIKQLPAFQFSIYSKFEFRAFQQYRHLHFHPIGNDFLQDRRDAGFLLATSGHQLISESLQMELPMLLFPMDTFEQHYNAYEVEKNGLGKEMRKFTAEEFLRFYNQRETFHAAICAYNARMGAASWQEQLVEELRRHGFL